MNGTIAGFLGFEVTSVAMTVTYYDQDGKAAYATSVAPRTATQRTQASSIRVLGIGDWGGTDVVPFYTPSQVAGAAGMNAVARNISSQFVVALGDNFYHYGINTTCESPRFSQSWDDVYNGEALQTDW